MTVFVASGTSDRMYHTSKNCYHLQKADHYVEKERSLIDVFYDECSACEEWERRQE